MWKEDQLLWSRVGRAKYALFTPNKTWGRRQEDDMGELESSLHGFMVEEFESRTILDVFKSNYSLSS